MPRFDRLRIPTNLWQAMKDHVQACLPEEACGLLVGRDGLAGAVVPVENAAHSPVRYRMEPHAQVRELLAIETQSLELLAIYHSHPAGPPFPSQTDRDEVFDPDTLMLVWCSGFEGWCARAFDLRGGAPVEVTVEAIAAV